MAITKEKVSLDELKEEEVVELAASGDNFALEYILDKYKNIIRIKTRTYFLVGADREDIIQEGMIGLFKAIRDYDKRRMISFKTFAELCITRQIITAVKSATRQKHIPLNSYISLNKPIYEEDSDWTLLDVLYGEEQQNPEDIVINKESMFGFEGRISEVLSAFELEVVTMYLKGNTYQEMAVTLSKPVKSIDNALQRIKKKLERYLDGYPV